MIEIPNEILDFVDETGPEIKLLLKFKSSFYDYQEKELKIEAVEKKPLKQVGKWVKPSKNKLF